MFVCLHREEIERLLDGLEAVEDKDDDVKHDIDECKSALASMVKRVDDYWVKQSSD